MAKLKDPADKVVEQKEEERLEDEARTFDTARLSLKDFKAIPVQVARSPHPFDGYPLGEKVKVSEGERSTTFIVGLNPKVYVHQDPSGKGVTIRKKQGKQILEKNVNIQTFHSRFVRDYEDGDKNREYVFDRMIQLADGIIYCSIVDSHTARAQICFKIEKKTGKIQVDDRYLLLDAKQQNLLRRVFNLIHTPQAKIERLSRTITGESDEAMEDVESTPLE
jgi:hypothetical protein